MLSSACAFFPVFFSLLSDSVCGYLISVSCLRFFLGLDFGSCSRSPWFNGLGFGLLPAFCCLFFILFSFVLTAIPDFLLFTVLLASWLRFAVVTRLLGLLFLTAFTFSVSFYGPFSLWLFFFCLRLHSLLVSWRGAPGDDVIDPLTVIGLCGPTLRL